MDHEHNDDDGYVGPSFFNGTTPSEAVIQATPKGKENITLDKPIAQMFYAAPSKMDAYDQIMRSVTQGLDLMIALTDQVRSEREIEDTLKGHKDQPTYKALERVINRINTKTARHTLHKDRCFKLRNGFIKLEPLKITQREGLTVV